MFPLLEVTKKIIQGIPMSHIAIGLAVLCLLFALPALFEPKKFRAALEEFFNGGSALMRVTALFHLLIAFLILNTHWTVKLDSSRSILTIIGYLILLRGIIWLWSPSAVKQLQHKFMQKNSSVAVIAILGLLFAIGFGYLGIWIY